MIERKQLMQTVVCNDLEFVQLCYSKHFCQNWDFFHLAHKKDVFAVNNGRSDTFLLKLGSL